MRRIFKKTLLLFSFSNLRPRHHASHQQLNHPTPATQPIATPAEPAAYIWIDQSSFIFTVVLQTCCQSKSALQQQKYPLFYFMRGMIKLYSTVSQYTFDGPSLLSFFHISHCLLWYHQIDIINAAAV